MEESYQILGFQGLERCVYVCLFNQAISSLTVETSHVSCSMDASQWQCWQTQQHDQQDFLQPFYCVFIWMECLDDQIPSIPLNLFSCIHPNAQILIQIYKILKKCTYVYGNFICSKVTSRKTSLESTMRVCMLSCFSRVQLFVTP